MESQVKHEYDESKREAKFVFSGGRQLIVGNVTREQAQTFAERHAPEFERRNCVLETTAQVTRS